MFVHDWQEYWKEYQAFHLSCFILNQGNGNADVANVTMSHS